MRALVVYESMYGNTHVHGMPTVTSRRAAADAARKEGSGLSLDPDKENTLLNGETARACSWGVLIGEAARAAYASGMRP